MWGIVRDITERKRAEIVLRDALLEASRFRQATENVSSYIYMKDLQSHYIYANKPTLELFGCSADELVGSDDARFFPPETVKRLREVDLRVFAGEQTYEEIDVAGTGSGRRVYLETKTPIYDDLEGKTICGLLGISTDITQRKRAEEALKELKLQAKLYLDLMGHDIRNMNQIGMGFLELALGSPDIGKDDKELLLKSLGSMENTTRLIDNVRKLQKARSGELKYQIVDACQTFMRVLAHYSNMPGVNASFNLDLPPSCPVRANDLLYEVFENLVGNAIKHGGPEPVIDIRYDMVDLDGISYIRFTVEDNGPGIPDDLKDRIFNRMQRGDTKAKGIGLGLYLVKSLVESYRWKGMGRGPGAGRPYEGRQVRSHAAFFVSDLFL